MKSAVHICMLIILLVISSCSSPPPPDFRNVNWGMSEKEVRIAEEKRLTDGGVSELGGRRLVCEDVSIADRVYARLEYHFIDDKLFFAIYWIEEKENQNKTRKQLINDLSDKLILIYGNPEINDSIVSWVYGNTLIRLTAYSEGVMLAFMNENLNNQRLKDQLTNF